MSNASPSSDGSTQRSQPESLRARDVMASFTVNDGAKGFDRVKGVGFAVQLTTTQDVDAIAARIKDQGGTLVMEPTDTPWGRVFRLKDPDGFNLVITSPRA